MSEEVADPSSLGFEELGLGAHAGDDAARTALPSETVHYILSLSLESMPINDDSPFDSASKRQRLLRRTALVARTWAQASHALLPRTLIVTDHTIERRINQLERRPELGRIVEVLVIESQGVRMAEVDIVDQYCPSS